MKLTRQQLAELARMTVDTRPSEIDCDEWLDQVGAYLDIVHAGRAVPEGLEIVAQHIDVCPDCRAEFTAMLEMLREGGDAE